MLCVHDCQHSYIIIVSPGLPEVRFKPCFASTIKGCALKPGLTPPAPASTGNIVAWNVKVGDTISAGDTLAEVETDKATMGWESQEEGFIAAILVPDGAKDLEIGMPLAVMVDEEVRGGVRASPTNVCVHE